MKRISLCCMFGGKSSEYEVSLRSVCSVIENLDREKYDVTLLGVTKAGAWYVYETDPFAPAAAEKICGDTWHRETGCLRPAVFLPGSGGTLLLGGAGGEERRQIDVVFPVMHGAFCEDGRLQGYLDVCGVPYVGSGCTASAVSMDKDFTKEILSVHGIPLAKWGTVSARQILKDPEGAVRTAEAVGEYPLFVKPANAGSSVGVSKVKGPEGMLAALCEAARQDEKILIEEYIRGKEVEVAVFDDGETLYAATPGEIEPGAEFYDYHDKYIGTESRIHLPARIRDDTKDVLKETAKRVFALLGCSGFSRVDFFVRENAAGEEEIVFNEINTLPGFTSISMYPKMMMYDGYSYGALIDALLTSARKKGGRS